MALNLASSSQTVKSMFVAMFVLAYFSELGVMLTFSPPPMECQYIFLKKSPEHTFSQVGPTSP